MKPENKKQNPEKKSRRKAINFLDVITGKMFTEEFIIKQSGLFILIFALILVFISNRYSCAKKLTEMDNLKKELISLEHQKINLNSRLTKISRQVQIEESLRRQGIELSTGNANVYTISK